MGTTTFDEREAVAVLLLLRQQQPQQQQQQQHQEEEEEEQEDGVEEEEEQEEQEEEGDDVEEEQEEEEEDDVEEEEEECDVEEEESESELEVKTCSQTNEKKGKKRKLVPEDDSEETLTCMRNWKNNMPENPPRKIFAGTDTDVVGDCSKPIWKQLTESDVKGNQCRLMLGKKPVEEVMVAVMGKSEKIGINGLEVSVYGPNGETHEMVFKKWGKDTPVFMSGWKNFVEKYKLEKHQHFLTIWMFRHKDTRKICFAIDCTRLPVRGKLSQRIINDVKNPNPKPNRK